MNKKYIVLLSSFIACSSWGMENDVEEVSSKVPSLLSLAARGVAHDIDRVVRENAREYIKDNALTTEYVLEDIRENFAVLNNLPLYLKDEVVRQYSTFYKESDPALCTQVLSHGGRVRQAVINDTGDCIAVVTSLADGKETLRVWQENANGWFSSGVVIKEWEPDRWGAVAQVCWQSHNQVLVTQKQFFTVLQKNNQGCFEFFCSRFVFFVPWIKDIQCAWGYDDKMIAILCKEDDFIHIKPYRFLNDNPKWIQNIFIPCGFRAKLTNVWLSGSRLCVHFDNGVRTTISLWHYSNEKGLYEEGERSNFEGPVGKEEIIDFYKKHNLPVERYLQQCGQVGEKSIAIPKYRFRAGKNVEVTTALPPLYAIAQRIVSTTKKNYRKNKGGNIAKRLKRDNNDE